MKVVLPFLRTPYNYDRNAASDESGLKCDDVTLTKQAFAEEADINTIVRRFHLTGQLPENVSLPQYGDFDAVVDFHSAMNVVAEARQAFDAMPANIRARFNNDAGAFVEFFNDVKNRDEGVKLGLVFDVKPQAQPAPAVVAPPSAPVAATGSGSPVAAPSTMV